MMACVLAEKLATCTILKYRLSWTNLAGCIHQSTVSFLDRKKINSNNKEE